MAIPEVSLSGFQMKMSLGVICRVNRLNTYLLKKNICAPNLRNGKSEHIPFKVNRFNRVKSVRW